MRPDERSTHSVRGLDAAELHRGIAERLVVVPAHFEGGVVVRAADRFFVVEHDGYT